MRLGILDVGSNTVHLLVVHASRGVPPTPVHSAKTVLRLVDSITEDGALDKGGVAELVRAIREAQAAAQQLGCEQILAFATSVLREATNVDAVCAQVVDETGIALRVLTGVDEARLIFLAARRWFGWSAGNLLVVDIGGGSLELAMGRDEDPALAESLPLGAARITRLRFSQDPPTRSELVATAAWLESRLGDVVEKVARFDRPDRVVATSKTFRSLARLAGGFSPRGTATEHVLTDTALDKLITFLSRMSSADLAQLDGVSGSRAHQLVAGALVGQATMRMLSLPALEMCPWALREGVILRRLDQSETLEQTALLTGQDWHG